MNRTVIRKLSMIIAFCLFFILMSACHRSRPTEKELETAIKDRYVGENDDPYDNIVEVNVLDQDVSEYEIYLLDLNGKDTLTAVLRRSYPPCRLICHSPF
jgi:hypothetical protein